MAHLSVQEAGWQQGMSRDFHLQPTHQINMREEYRNLDWIALKLSSSKLTG